MRIVLEETQTSKVQQGAQTRSTLLGHGRFPALLLARRIRSKLYPYQFHPLGGRNRFPGFHGEQVRGFRKSCQASGHRLRDPQSRLARSFERAMLYDSQTYLLTQINRSVAANFGTEPHFVWSILSSTISKRQFMRQVSGSQALDA
jgi:hypothetical protein